MAPTVATLASSVVVGGVVGGRAVIGEGVGDLLGHGVAQLLVALGLLHGTDLAPLLELDILDALGSSHVCLGGGAGKGRGVG